MSIVMDREIAIAKHNERNAALIATFLIKQIDLHEVRFIELHFWAASQAKAVRLAQELYRQNFLVLVLKPAEAKSDTKWNVEAGVDKTIDGVVASDFAAKLVDLAMTFDAVFDGWGTSI